MHDVFYYMIYQEIASNKRKSIFLITLFTLVVLALGYLFAYVQNAPPQGYLTIALMISAGSALFSYYTGDRVALATSAAQMISVEDNPYVYRIVENLSIATGLPVPKVYIINDPAINAFATGRSPEHASIAVTTGAIEKLENEELEGVIAHELSHIKNYDIRFMMLTAVLVGSIAILADFFLRSTAWFGGRRSDRGAGDGRGIAIILGIVFALLSPIIAELIKLAVSRKREFLADATGALTTRYPEGLARALEKIGAENQPLSTASHATAHLYFAHPFRSRGFKSLFSTHPPIEERVRRLRAMGQ
jgi:heat shock protein HtpX